LRAAPETKLRHHLHRNERKLAEFLSRNGQFLLPMVDLIEQSRMAVEDLIKVASRVTIKAVPNLSS
jgi:hypothetical protein